MYLHRGSVTELRIKFRCSAKILYTPADPALKISHPHPNIQPSFFWR